MGIEEILMWLSRYWIGGIITLGFLDTVNWVMSKATSNERFTNMERLWMFILWPVMLSVFVFMFVLSMVRRWMSKNGK